MSRTERSRHPDLPMLVHSLQATDSGGALRELQGALAAAEGVVDAGRLVADISQRWASGACYLADDIAFLHARTSGVERVVAALGRSAEGIRFDAAHPRVRLVVIVGAPQAQIGEYLRFTSELARELRRPASRAELEGFGEESRIRERWSQIGA